MDIVAVINSVAPGALPAAAIVWVWWKLDHRITVLETRWEILWEKHLSEMEK